MKLLPYILLLMLIPYMLILACELKEESNLFAVQDLTIYKGSGKFKYKSDNSSEAYQGWKIAGECPTAYKNFNQAYYFRIRVRQMGEKDSLNHGIYDSTGVMGRDGTRYKKRFIYYPASRSKGHRNPSFGFFKGWIKDGIFKFQYAVTKANEGGMMMSMQYYDDIKNTMSASNKFKAAANIGATIEIGSEVHNNASMVKYTAKEKITKAKLVKK